MDIVKAFDEAAAAEERLRNILSAQLRDGTVRLLTPGFSGEVGGEHHPKIGVHLAIDREEFTQRQAEFAKLVQPLKDTGVEVVFFPE